MSFLRFFVTFYFLYSSVFAGEEPTTTPSSFVEDIIHMTSTLLILLLFVAGALFIIKKLMRGRMKYMNRSTSIKILEKRALHPKASLYLIEALGKVVLISEAQGQINLITEMERPPLPLQEELDSPPKHSFTDILKNKLLKNSKKESYDKIDP